MDDLADWLQRKHGLNIDARLLVDPARAAERIGGIASAKAAELPFDTEPTGFWRLFNELTKR